MLSDNAKQEDKAAEGLKTDGATAPEAAASEADSGELAGEIDQGKQNKHIPGTNENKTAGPGKSTWKDPSEANSLTEEARAKGVVDRIRTDGSKVIKWDAGRKVGSQGETQVTVHVGPGGNYHGHPSGPRQP